TLEFRRMVAFSAAFHLVAVGVVLITTVFSSRHYVEAASQGPINVMWATTIHAPAPTSPNKLPGPMVVPDVAPPAKKEEAKIVMPEDQKKMKETKAERAKESEEDARRKAMAEALASVQKDVEKRPVPRADNFPSTVKGAEKGLPSGPGGVAGILGGDPI